MEHNPIAQKAIEEVLQQNFGVTEQFLKIHELVHKDGLPDIIMIDDNSPYDCAIVYFAVKDEQFYLAVYVDTTPEIAVRGVHTEYYSSIFLSAYSTTMNVEEMSAITVLNPLRSWNKGDKVKPYKNPKKSSAIFIEPNPGPGLFETKLDKLLDSLEQDLVGVTNLVDKTEAGINVILVCHNGNTMLGGPLIGKSAVKRIAALNLQISFDIYAGGNPFIE